MKTTSNQDEEDGEDGADDNEPLEANDEPPAFAADSDASKLIPGVTDKPIKLNIQSRPPEKSPYTKVFNVIISNLLILTIQKVVEKFKILPKSTPAKKGDEETKGEDKKISMGKGYFSLEEASVNDSSVFIVVFRNLIGKTLYQGSFSAVHSKKRRIEEKAMKLQLKLALLVKDTETQKFKVDYVVISFSRMEELKEFEEKFDEAINKLKQNKKE